MPDKHDASSLENLDPSGFDITGLDDEIRVDRHCVALLRELFAALSAAGASPLEAGALCHGADYFLREFVIGEYRENLFRIAPVRVRQFAGHWYIIRTMEPNRAELASILAGVDTFYRFCAEHRWVAPSDAEQISAACTDLPYYLQRIDDFWAISGDGYDAWRAACPLDPPPCD